MPKTEPFDNLTLQYDDWFVENEFIYQSEVNAVKKVLSDGKGLEIGIGTGRFAVPLGIKEGVEPSKEMAKIALERGLNVTDGIAEKLPINDSQYDFVLLVTTICFIDNVDLAFKEINRVLKPKGSVVIGFVDKDSPIGKFYLSIKEKSPFYKDATFWGTNELVSKLKENNFSNFRTVQTIFGALADVKEVQQVKEGFGEGSFVVIKADKNN